MGREKTTTAKDMETNIQDVDYLNRLMNDSLSGDQIYMPATGNKRSVAVEARLRRKKEEKKTENQPMWKDVIISTFTSRKTLA